jgi:hypothetical protein
MITRIVRTVLAMVVACLWTVPVRSAETGTESQPATPQAGQPSDVQERGIVAPGSLTNVLSLLPPRMQFALQSQVPAPQLAQLIAIGRQIARRQPFEANWEAWLRTAKATNTVRSAMDVEASVFFVLVAFEEQVRSDLQDTAARVAHSNQVKDALRQELDRIKDHLRCATRTGGGSTAAVSSPYVVTLPAPIVSLIEQRMGSRLKAQLEDGKEMANYMKALTDALGDTTQQLTFEIQQIMTRIPQVTQVRSNIAAKLSAIADQIIGNIRG